MLDTNHNSYKATIEDELVLIKNAIENKQKLPEIAKQGRHKAISDICRNTRKVRFL